MKIFIISKNKIIITLTAILVISMFILNLTNKQQLFCNSVATNEFQNKISNLVNEKKLLI